MADNILFVFEGEKTEPQILETLRKYYFLDDAENDTKTPVIVYATFNTHIYTLWDEVKKDEYLDLLEIIRERNEKNAAILTGFNRDDISRIFLFFDYDGHVNEASDETIEEMLAHFSSPNENGMLYISYPMVEALKHLQTDIDFKDITVPAKDKIVCKERQAKYKSFVSQLTMYQNLTTLTKDNWNHIILENFKKANLIVNDCFEIPSHNEIAALNQMNIFNHQLKKYINTFQLVAVLSAFPFFIVEYFEEEKIKITTSKN